MTPGRYRVHFETEDRDGPLYFDVEIRKNHPRAFVRDVGPNSSAAAIKRFTSPSRQIYLDTLYPGCRPQFHMWYHMAHKVSRVESLAELDHT